MPQLLSVQCGLARRTKIGERSILTAYGKQAVAGSVPVLPLGLPGDEQADLPIHGGLEKAVHAYPSEHYAGWQAARREAGLGRRCAEIPGRRGVGIPALFAAKMRKHLR
ncbi:MAG: hypothetical protein I8H91_11355 [Burkholderiales bacterium]|nr:hypothetical protein [Burkholderiales bacterium]